MSCTGRAVCFLAITLPLAAQLPPQAKWSPPDWLEFHDVDIYSEGTRMHGETFIAKDRVGTARPCLVMAHGWGGTTAALRRDAVAFAKAGYFVTSFDYRGWASSDARVVLTKPAPPAENQRPAGVFTAEVREVRGVVDPIDMGSDWLNAIHWVAAEKQCDMARLGLWGSSFSGGLVVYAAARDRRVKAIHSQVGSLDGRTLDATAAEREGTRYARGGQTYPEPYKKVIGNLIGAPMAARFQQYFPVEEVNLAPKTAMQFVIAANEELFDNRSHAIRAYEAFNGVKRLVRIPDIKHYGIYYEAHDEALKLALEWFGTHLK